MKQEVQFTVLFLCDGEHEHWFYGYQEILVIFLYPRLLDFEGTPTFNCAYLYLL